MKQPHNTALYMRLSRDDERFGDSVSIETQRTILRKFAQEQQLHVVDEYVDDGWSGTSFERPAFQRMMDDVDSGKITCIVVKDLSRFGREHVTMDFYLEYVFPEKKVRFIAVAENEDTERGLSDFVPFKNLFNEWYAKDTSRKVKTALHAKHAAGERMVTYAPLGYMKDPNRRNHLIVDPETKWIIEKIFDMALHGAGSAKIGRVLISEKVPTPGFVQYQRYGKFAHIYADQPEEKSYAWTLAAIKSILRDETYIGNTVHNKQSNISYKNKRRIRKPEEEWVRVEGTHEAIISKDVFYRVQEQIDHRRRRMKDATTQIFAGLLRCSDCGWSLSFATNKSNKTPYSYYNCLNYRQYGKSLGKCTAHYVRYDVLYSYVLSRLQYWSRRAAIDEATLYRELLNAGDKEKAATSKKQAAALAKAEKRKAEVDRLFMKLYEDWSADRITEYNFTMLSEKYQDEQQALTDQIAQLKEALTADRQTTENTAKWLELIKRYVNPTALTAEMLNELIEKIVIHEAVKGESGQRTQKIEIYYRFVGKID